MRSVGLKLALRDHICLVHTFVFVRRCMGQGTSHAHCASEEPLRLVASYVGGQSSHSKRELMCTASFMMVAQPPRHASSPRDQKEIGGYFAYNFTDSCLYVCGPSSTSEGGAVHSRPVKLVNRSGVILHFVCRNGPHVLRLGWRLGCARRHRPNPSKSQYQPRGGAVVTRRAIALVLSTHTHRVAKPKVGRRLMVDACLT